MPNYAARHIKESALDIIEQNARDILGVNSVREHSSYHDIGHSAYPIIDQSYGYIPPPKRRIEYEQGQDYRVSNFETDQNEIILP